MRLLIKIYAKENKREFLQREREREILLLFNMVLRWIDRSEKHKSVTEKLPANIYLFTFLFSFYVRNDDLDLIWARYNHFSFLFVHVCSIFVFF
jgi:hypothetical protein